MTNPLEIEKSNKNLKVFFWIFLQSSILSNIMRLDSANNSKIVKKIHFAILNGNKDINERILAIDGK